RDAAARRSAPAQPAPARPLFGRAGRGFERAKFWRRSVPGGASGLQIREGPRAGPWWVRLPLSSARMFTATIGRRAIMTPAAQFLERLRQAAESASVKESVYPREAGARITGGPAGGAGPGGGRNGHRPRPLHVAGATRMAGGQRVPIGRAGPVRA